MTREGEIRVFVDIEGTHIPLKVSYCYQSEPSGHYDIEPYSDLSWWFTDRSIDQSLIPEYQIWRIEESIWADINDTPSAI